MTGGEYRYALQLGAERERRRIRRAQVKALGRLLVLSKPLADGVWRDLLIQLDAATRSKARRK
jgi:hypothetical protein